MSLQILFNTIKSRRPYFLSSSSTDSLKIDIDYQNDNISVGSDFLRSNDLQWSTKKVTIIWQIQMATAFDMHEVSDQTATPFAAASVQQVQTVNQNDNSLVIGQGKEGMRLH